MEIRFRRLIAEAVSEKTATGDALPTRKGGMQTDGNQNHHCRFHVRMRKGDYHHEDAGHSVNEQEVRDQFLWQNQSGTHQRDSAGGRQF
jgi:hypothetical protein